MKLTYLSTSCTVDILSISLHEKQAMVVGYELKFPNLTLHITVIYRPPKPENIPFFDDFTSSSSYLPIVLGDLNITLILLSIPMVTLNF